MTLEALHAPPLAWQMAAFALGSALGAVAFLALLVTDWTAWVLVLPGRVTRASSRDEPPGGEPLSLQTPDGLRLAGTWFPAEPVGRKIALLLHGLAEDATALGDRVGSLRAAGWSVATLDSRAHGRSEGHRGSFGGREADDLALWIAALKEKAQGAPPAVALWGRSKGAAIAVRAAAADPTIAAVVLEAPFPDLHAAVTAVLKGKRIPCAGLLARLALRRAEALAGVPLDRPRPLDLAPRVRAPALVLHGTRDALIPLDDARRFAAAFAVRGGIVEVEGAGHASVVAVGGAPLFDRVTAFLEDAAGGPAPPAGPGFTSA